MGRAMELGDVRMTFELCVVDITLCEAKERISELEDKGLRTIPSAP